MFRLAFYHYCIIALIGFWLFDGIAMAADSDQNKGSYLITKVTDGDSLWAGDLRIRLHGIDAPEMRQNCTDKIDKSYKCGIAARNHLLGLIQPPAELQCQQLDKDRYGRLVMRCYKAGIDINAAMVRAGWAIAYRRYAKDYIAEENQAKALKKGLFAGKFQTPEQWRREN